MRTLERLQGMRGVRLHGIADPARADERTPTFCLTFDRHTPREARRGAGPRGHLHLGRQLLRARGHPRARPRGVDGGALRAGYLHYTTADEVDRFLDRLEALAAGYG